MNDTNKKETDCLFSHIDSHQITLAKKCYPANQVIFKEGENTNELYILLKGSVVVMKGGKRLHVIKSQGNIFGEISALLQTPRSATIVTEEPCEIVKLSSDMLLKLMNASPELCVSLAKMLAKRLVWTSEIKKQTIE